MARVLGDTLPKEIMQDLDGRYLERKFGSAYLMVTTDADGTPRPCMLSAGEVLARDEKTLRVGLWPHSNTSRNLARGSPVLICFVAPGTVLYVKGRARPLAPVEGVDIARFEVTVTVVESDLHEGLPVVQGISFTSETGDIGPILDGWRRVLAALAAD
jgi:hypothetical protein